MTKTELLTKLGAYANYEWRLFFFKRLYGNYTLENVQVQDLPSYAKIATEIFSKRKVNFLPDEEISIGVSELGDQYSYMNVIMTDDIDKEFSNLISKMRSPEQLNENDERTYTGYILAAVDENNDFPLIFIRKKTPIYNITGKRLLTFSEDKMLKDVSNQSYLVDENFDISIVGDHVFMLSVSGEDFLGIPRYFTENAKSYADRFIALDLFSNNAAYKATAAQNSFSKGYLNLKNNEQILAKSAKSIIDDSKKLEIHITEDNKFDCSFKENLEAINYYLCEKIKIDAATEKRTIHGAKGKEYKPPVKPSSTTTTPTTP